MKPEPLSVYADTSVFGGVLDEEFSEPSGEFFQQVREGRFELVISPLVARELDLAPPEVREVFRDLLPLARVAEITVAASSLRQAYLQAGILPQKHAEDALHVAIASVSGCSVIVSWNFGHIVNFHRISLYNRMNGQMGLPTIGIHSPREVVEHEDEDI